MIQFFLASWETVRKVYFGSLHQLRHPRIQDGSLAPALVEAVHITEPSLLGWVWFSKNSTVGGVPVRPAAQAPPKYCQRVRKRGGERYLFSQLEIRPTEWLAL